MSKRNRNNSRGRGNSNKPKNTHERDNGAQTTETNQSQNSTSSNTNADGSGTSKTEDANQKNKTAINDPEWYMKFPELSKGAANLPFGEKLGNPVRYGDLDIDTTNTGGSTVYTFKSGKAQSAIPGICSLVTKPSYGHSVNINNALNVAASQFYTNVRYVNSGRKNYDPADLMLAEMAIADLYAFINWAQRLYGYTYMYSMRNSYINEALIEANHVNADALKQSLANFRYWLNTFISRVSAFAVPADINIFRRRAFMYAHLYTESTTGNIKDQLYQFVPDGFFKFQLDATGKGMLKYIRIDEFVHDQWTLQNLMAFGEGLLANITNDEDFGLISGDIIKAYGSNLIGLSPVPEALIIIPEYEEYTLSQMRNAHIVSALACGNSYQSFKITGNNDETFQTGNVMQANNGNLICVEAVKDADKKNQHIYSFVPGIITVTNPDPSLDDVVEATRLVTCACPTDQDDVQDSYNLSVLTTGSDIVVKWIMSQYVVSNNAIGLEHISVDSNAVYSSTTVVSELLNAMHFHWAPLLFRYSLDNTEHVFSAFDVLSNIDNYTTLSWRNVYNLNEVAFMSLLSVPGVAALVG